MSNELGPIEKKQYPDQGATTPPLCTPNIVVVSFCFSETQRNFHRVATEVEMGKEETFGL